MIKKLRIKFVLIIMTVMVVMFIGVLIAVNIITNQSIYNQSLNKLYSLASSDGYSIGSGGSKKSESYTNTFSVKLNYKNEITEFFFSRGEQISDEDFVEQISDLVNEALTLDEDIGSVSGYLFLIKDKPYGKLIVFLDNTQQEEQARTLFITTLFIGIFVLLLLAVISSVLAYFITKPIKAAFDKQKSFISDASHELKTPLAVINANAEVLEGEIGSNKWLDYIKAESDRMNELVFELLSLARMDDNSHKAVFSEIDLSSTVLRTVLPFESTVFESGKKLITDVDEHINLRADESKIKHLVSILLDNAIKYSDENGTIKVSLHLQAGRPILEVYNTGIGIEKKDYKMIFERFFREDSARNSAKGGYGLGLAIAKSIVEEHNGKISVQSEYGHWITFTASFQGDAPQSFHLTK